MAETQDMADITCWAGPPSVPIVSEKGTEVKVHTSGDTLAAVHFESRDMLSNQLRLFIYFYKYNHRR